MLIITSFHDQHVANTFLIFQLWVTGATLVAALRVWKTANNNKGCRRVFLGMTSVLHCSSLSKLETGNLQQTAKAVRIKLSVTAQKKLAIISRLAMEIVHLVAAKEIRVTVVSVRYLRPLNESWLIYPVIPIACNSQRNAHSQTSQWKLKLLYWTFIW